jgi:hypothetical protein
MANDTQVYMYIHFMLRDLTIGILIEYLQKCSASRFDTLGDL